MTYLKYREKIPDEKVILLVEDNNDDVELTLRAFKKNNITNKIIVAEDGANAMDYLFGKGRDTSHLPDLILLDLKMPRMNGLELLRHIRNENETKYISVVILTSSREEQDIINSYELGANSYIQKPMDFMHFIEAIEYLGPYWLFLNETPFLKGRYT